MTPELMIAGVMLVALVVYTLTGGADFGGGVWQLLAWGPRKAAQRRLVDDSIKPIWEANHVWLILLIVLLFVCFPTAFAAVCTALHLPLALMLVGIVLRGSAFVFAHYDPLHGRGALRWGGVFAVASLLTPITLGVVLGALGTGFDVDPATGLVDTDFLSEWLAPYPLAVGLFTLALFAFLAAVYLVREADDPDLRADFRARALGSAVVVGVTALIAYLVAPPVIRHDLRPARGPPRCTSPPASPPWSRSTPWGPAATSSRASAMAQVTLIVVGWAVAQYPYLAYPGYTIAGTAAPASVLTPILVALAIGGLVLFPSLAYLFVVFKRRPAA
ncbi:cytochrome d ubiquinol oxidase subunit II [Nannocystis pusilla]|uniref:cytochrome d ubiquinol oxidase subunit II n=1 Tax=Nannocystis pusilla TaxID=889268 RepID=UPI003B7E9567